MQYSLGGDINGEKSLENNSDDEYHPPIRKQKRHQKNQRLPMPKMTPV
jgi:hypothetical protein